VKGATFEVSPMLRAALPVIALLIGAACLALAAPQPALRLQPSPVRQGQSLLLTVEAGAVTGGSCRWNGKEYPLYANGDRLEAFLPVAYGIKPGGRKVAVSLTMAGETVRLQRVVTVQPTDFGVQRLRMAKQTRSLYDLPSVKEESRLIGQALARRMPLRSWNGPFLKPVSGRISTRYGLLRYINGKPEYRHRGVDIAAKRGLPVRAAEAGAVALARDDFQLHGRTVVLDHGEGVSSLYLHMDSIAVKEGDVVQRGEVIGRVGSSGAATGPHLHWGVYVQREPVDPLFWTKWSVKGEE
jgi:murein DD-endopeptidase MepM/ murein hydrolase activator NlpD